MIIAPWTAMIQSAQLFGHYHTEINDEWLFRYEGQHIALPIVCPPSREFLEFHRENIFQH